MLNADTYFEIGHSHDVCEDYSLAGLIDQGAYAIVCDGCSTAQHTDLGARLLAHGCVDFLNNDIILTPALYHYQLFDLIELTCRQIKSKNIIGNSKDYLMATLLLALVHRDKLYLVVVGDGNVIIRYKDNEQELYNFEYSNNAPFYPIYYTDDNIKREYFTNYPDENLLVTTNINTVETLPVNVPYILTKDIENIQSISICSDGLSTYHKDKQPMILNQVMSEFTSFKNFTGQFVKRRLKSYKRKCLKENIKHEDDISIATIYFEE